MSLVTILGAGELGGAVAHALAKRDFLRNIVLIDASVDAARGKALDLQQSGAIERFHAHLEGTDDIARVTGCDVCVVADRFARSDRSTDTPEHAAEWQGDEALAMLSRVVSYLGRAPLVFAGARQADLIAKVAGELRVGRERLVGSSPEALASAVRGLVALEAGCSPTDVSLTVLGVPSAGFVVPWSEAAIGGYALERVLDQVQRARLEARVQRLWPLGVSVLGTAAARVAEAIMTSSRRPFSILTMLEGEFETRHRIGAVPSWLWPRGIARTRTPRLNTREHVQLGTILGR